MPTHRTRVRAPIRDRHLLRRMLAGAHPALPLPLDRASDWWADRQPRARVAVAVLLVVLGMGVAAARVRAAQTRWGGPPIAVLVATDDIGVGEPPTRVRRVDVPPALAPPGAVLDPGGGVLAIALPSGTVLTERHLTHTGPAVGLPPDLRAVPITVEEGWGVVPGGWVDVWVLSDGAAADPAHAAARSRPVLELREDDLRRTALVGLAADEVRLVTRGLAEGRILLAHAPPPAPERAAGRPDGR
jgi:hypothetical protein